MGLRGRLLLLVLLPAIPGLFLAIYSGLEQRGAHRETITRDAVRVVQLAAGHQRATIDTVLEHLTSLSRLPKAFSTNLAMFDSFFKQMRETYVIFSDMGLLETNGNLVSCSYPSQRPSNVADRAFFQRVLSNKDFSIGSYHAIGPKGPNLTFAYPILGPKQGFGRVLYASLDLAILNRQAARTEIPKDGIVHVLDQRGIILARWPGPEKWVGKPFPDLKALAAMQSRRQGTIETRSAGDVKRLSAFTPLGSGSVTNLLVTVGIPLSAAYAEVNRRLAMNMTLLGIVALLALVTAWIYADKYVLRPVRALTATTRQVTDGDLGARTGLPQGPGELNELARVFDHMTERLQQQRLQNENLQAELEDRVKERTAELELSNKELEAFSYSVSHDLRAPLRHIHGYIDKLQEDAAASLNAENRELLKLVATSTKRMGTLIDDLLEFSRMGRVELSKTSVNMDELLAEVLQEIQRDTEGRTITWTIDPLPVVFGDRALLKQVWANLLFNAVKYTRHRANAEISVTARTFPHEFEFCVRDNGAGFDMRHADKLFRVFERLHNPDEFEGTGIGLANVRRIIIRHRGRTWAEGKLDAGAAFYFTLPVLKPVTTV